MNTEPKQAPETDQKSTGGGINPLPTPELWAKVNILANIAWVMVVIFGAVMQSIYIIFAGMSLMAGYLVAIFGPVFRTSLRKYVSFLPYIAIAYIFAFALLTRDYRILAVGGILQLLYMAFHHEILFA